MLKPQIIFCHGFGLTPAYWDRIAPLFRDFQCHFWDLGYFNRPHLMNIPDHIPLIGIGHSFGMTTLISSQVNFQSIIGLNGFTCFLGYDPALNQWRQKELRHMQKQFKLRPERTLKSFMQRTGIDLELPAHLNLNKLNEDLNQLNQAISVSTCLASLLIIGSHDDPIVPPEIIQDNTKVLPKIQHIFLSSGKHALGYQQTDKIHTIIREFIDANR